MPPKPKVPQSMLDVSLGDLRLPHQVTVAGQNDVQLVITDTGNTYTKAGSMTARNGMVVACEPSAVAQPQNIIYGHQAALSIISVSNPTAPSESFIVGEDALAEATNMARIGTLQERFNASPAVLRAQLFNAVFRTLMQKTATAQYKATIVLGLEVPIEDYQGQAEAKTGLFRGIAETLKGEWRIENSRGVLSLSVIGIVPLPQTYGMIVGYCTDPHGKIIPERSTTRFSALDMGGGQFHLGRSVGTKQFAGQLVGRGITQTAENLMSIAAKKQKIRMTFPQAVHALHTHKAPDGGTWVDIGYLVQEAKDLSRLTQVSEAANIFSAALRQAHGLIGGGSALHYGQDILDQLAEEFHGKAEVVSQPQLANMLGGYVLMLSHLAAQEAARAKQQ